MFCLALIYSIKTVQWMSPPQKKLSAYKEIIYLKLST